MQPKQPPERVLNGIEPIAIRSLWSWYLPAAKTLRKLSTQSALLFAGHRIWIAAIVVGAVPFLISFGAEVRGHQIATGILLSFLMLALVRRDAVLSGIACMVIAFAAHSFCVITASRIAPERTSSVIPDGDWYWDKQIRWIRTGEDTEYQWQTWLPAHVQLAAGTSLYTFTSLGTLTFVQGFYQVDLMNYYNGRLAAESQSRTRSLALGWHLWSLMRGIGYLFLTFELLSLSFQTFSGMIVSSLRRRTWRWGIGIAFLSADCLIKWFCTEQVRQMLEDNLLS